MQESTANQRSMSEGMRTHGCLPLHFPLPFPVDLLSSPNLTHHPHVCTTALRPHVGSALFGDRAGHRPHPRVTTIFSILIPILIVLRPQSQAYVGASTVSVRMYIPRVVAVTAS